MPPADRPDVDEVLVRAALGEPLSAEEQAVLDGDPALRAEADSLREVVELAQSAPEAVEPEGGLGHLWDGIAAEAFGGERPSATPPPVAPRTDTPASTDDDGPVADVVPLRRRTAMWAGLSAVAAAAAAVVALATVGPLAGDDPRPVAAAELQPFGDADVSPVTGNMVLADGTTELRLDLSGLPDTDQGFYEVWLLDPEEGRLVSLGPARADGTYALPSGTEVDDFPAVDVSVEPRDGDPGHSGASVLRGPVTTTT